MRISIDVRHLASGPLTGVGVVTREIVPALAAVAPEDEFHIFYNGYRPPPNWVEEWSGRHQNMTLHVSRIPNRLYDAAVQTLGTTGTAHNLKEMDVHFSPHMLPLPRTGTPRVLVLHDLSFVRHPEYFHPRRRFWHKRIAPATQARAAKKIIVPSESTARDVTSLWGIDEHRVHVVPWAPPKLPKQPTVAARKTILFLGTVEHRKNVANLLKAFSALRMDDVELVLAGGLGWGSGSVQESIRENSVISLLGYVSEQKKAELLAQASVLVCPSFYEGSSLPAFEAMAAGVPCVVSQRTALPEVVGDAALLVDPDRPEELTQAMRILLTDKDLAATLIRRGKERAASYTWESTAKQVFQVLKSAAKK